MSIELKYIKTQDDEIIIFPMGIQHDTFKKFNPVSAGFCRVRSNKRKVHCYGESFSLGLKSEMREDSLEATKSVFGIHAMLDILKDYESADENTDEGKHFLKEEVFLDDLLNYIEVGVPLKDFRNMVYSRKNYVINNK